MKQWQQWLGARIAELKSTSPDTTYERIGQRIREELRHQQDLDPTQRKVLSKLEDIIPGKLGIFIGKVYRTYIKSEWGRGVARSSTQRDTQ
jgi:hypothetical protein